MKRVILCAVGLALVAALGPLPATFGEAIYWAEAGKICRANLDGSGAQDVVAGFPEGIALDVGRGKVYWTDNPPVGAPGPSGRIVRANLDGSGPELLASSLPYPVGIALELESAIPEAGRIYWTDSSSQDLHRSSLDGTSPAVLVSGLASPFGIALDEAGGKMYWTRNVADEKVAAVERANLDGSALEALAKALGGPTTGLALDPAHGKMYWGYVDPLIDGLAAGQIRRSNLDGSGIETVAAGLIFPAGIALDLGAGEIYWTDSGAGQGTGKIQRARLDGSVLETVLDGLETPRGIALDLTPEPATLVLVAAGGLAMLLRGREGRSAKQRPRASRTGGALGSTGLTRPGVSRSPPSGLSGRRSHRTRPPRPPSGS